MTAVDSYIWPAYCAAARAAVTLAGVALQLFLYSVSASACIWDRDTLSAEAIGLPEVIDVIVGRFDRPPAKFYEIRLRTVTEQLRKEPNNWTLYDDAGAAADRLHRGDEAIAWMKRKHSSLLRAAVIDANHGEHTYRYHANLGTFHAHRWLRAGAKRDRLDDLTLARKHIAEAIRLNPQAHFGRERYQLMAIEWLLESPDPKKDHRASSLFWVVRDSLGPAMVGKQSANQLAAAGYGDSVLGLTGLIVLGDAWQSIDIHLALAQALTDQGNIAAAKLATLRVRRLLEAGRHSLLPGNDKEHLEAVAGQIVKANPYQTLPSFYREATIAANNRQLYRDTYVNERLDAGRHPDTDPGFWKDYVEPPALRLQAKKKPIDKVPLVIGVFLAIALPLPLFVEWRRRRKASKESDCGSTDEARDGKVGIVPILATIAWVLIWAMIGRPYDSSELGTILLYAVSPLLLLLVWWVGHRLLGLPPWTFKGVLRHLGNAALLLMAVGVVVVAISQRPDNHRVEWKQEVVSTSGIGRVP